MTVGDETHRESSFNTLLSIRDKKVHSRNPFPESHVERSETTRLNSQPTILCCRIFMTQY